MRKILIFIFFIIILIFSVNIFALDKAISCNSSYGKTINISPSSYCQNVGGVNVTMFFISMVKNNYDINYTYKVYCSTTVECQYSSNNPCASDSNTYLDSFGQCDIYKQCWDSSKVKQSEQCPIDTRVTCFDGSKADTQEQCPVNPCLDLQKKVVDLTKNLERIKTAYDIAKSIYESLSPTVDPNNPVPTPEYPNADGLSTTNPVSALPDSPISGLPDDCIVDDPRPACWQDFIPDSVPDTGTGGTGDTGTGDTTCTTCCNATTAEINKMRKELAAERARAKNVLSKIPDVDINKRTGFDAGFRDAVDKSNYIFCDGNPCGVPYCDLHPTNSECSIRHEVIFKELTDFGQVNNGNNLCVCSPYVFDLTNIHFARYTMNFGHHVVTVHCDMLASVKENFQLILSLCIAITFTLIVLSA